VTASYNAALPSIAAMSVNVKQFIQQLTTIGLLTADEVAPFVERLSQERDAKAAERLARELIREKRLTAFQAQAALQGKAKNLVLGNYLILEKIGQGGMGMVLKARHKRMDRVVALKILSAKALQSPDAVKRFEREVQAAARLNHPNIVTAFDADEAHGTHFLVMEYVEGKNLSSLVKEKGPLPVQQAVECILQAARGLEFAHGKGIIHRDIKAGNLLLNSDGIVKMLDMGLARLESVTGEQSELTGTGQIMGTVDFMAPEQAVNTKDADQRSDIYSLGMTLWFLLTGRMAYGGDTLMAKLIAHREQPIPSLVPVLSGGPQRPVSPMTARLNDVFQKMVAKKPDDRYASMTHLIAALLRCQEGQAGPPTIPLGPGEDSKFSAFLKGVGGASTGVQTAARPAMLTGLEETLVTATPQGDTDPETNLSLAASALTWQEFRQHGKSWLRNWRVRVAAIGSVVGLSLIIGLVVASRSFRGPGDLVSGVPAEAPPPRGLPPAPVPSVATPAVPAINGDGGGTASHTIVPGQQGANRPALEKASAYNGHSYKYYPEQLSWKAAKTNCESLGGHLVVIDAIAENQFIAGLMSKAGALDAWIGITDEAVEGEWRTVTGQRQIYTNWSSDQPNNQGQGEHFALISNRTFGTSSMAWMWADQRNESGTFSPGYVCEWDELPISGGP
jgi:serine/threonine protein kinase